MAKREKKLVKSLRARGLRKKTARSVVRSATGGSKPRPAKRAIADLASVVDDVRDLLRYGPEKRSAAGKKAAKTRKRKARKRSETAKRGARTRAVRGRKETRSWAV
jgi:hypothetical protein